MDEVWARADEEEEGFLVLAEEQTGGRGRFQRAWLSPPGGSLMLSVLVRPPLPRAALLPALLALAAAEAIEQTTGLRVRLKWPNDLLVDGQKTGGVLVESRLRGDEATLVGGIGINVNFDPHRVPGIPATATSLSQAAGHAIDRRALLSALLDRLDALYDRLLAGGDLIPQWRERIETLGKTVEVRAGDRVVRGQALDVDRAGRLLVRLPSGALEALAAGEVTLQR
jgi:BirA family biotin operon repressor/biotin-[acetyl-CoA-carboxylase] ligase